MMLPQCFILYRLSFFSCLFVSVVNLSTFFFVFFLRDLCVSAVNHPSL